MDLRALRSCINTSALYKETVREIGGTAAGSQDFFRGVELVFQERSIWG